MFNVFRQFFHLINGTGNACAWHRSAKSSPRSFTNDHVLVSLANVGAFAPTGSEEIFEIDYQTSP